MAANTKNGGSSLNNNNCKDHSGRKLLVGVDLFCLFLGKSRVTVGTFGGKFAASCSFHCYSWRVSNGQFLARVRLPRLILDTRDAELV